MGELVKTNTYRSYIPDCFCCFDEGHVVYTKSIDEKLHSYVARCFCKAGNSYSKSIPLITSIYDKYEYTKRNFENWYERHKAIQEVAQILKKKGLIE